MQEIWLLKFDFLPLMEYFGKMWQKSNVNSRPPLLVLAVMGLETL